MRRLWHNTGPTMSSIKVSAKQMSAIPCPTCGAGPGEKCELSTGQPRKTPHRDRRWQARTVSCAAKGVRNVSPSVTFPSNISSELFRDDFNEYRLCQGFVEFRATHGAWCILGEDEVQLHYVLHTEVAKWLKGQSANQNGIGVTPGNSQPIASPRALQSTHPMPLDRDLLKL